jgi:Sec-independent protein translocase protein TatA
MTSFWVLLLACPLVSFIANEYRLTIEWFNQHDAKITGSVTGGRMEDWIKLVEALAWPIVALITLIILGPGGVLIRFSKNLAESVSDFRKSLPDLQNTALTLRADVNTLVERSRDLSTGFSSQVKELEDRLDGISAKLGRDIAAIKAVLDELDRSKIAEDQAEIKRVIDASGDADVARDLDMRANGMSTDEMMDGIRGTWSNFVDVFRRRLGSSFQFDGRQIGALAWQLADRRRSNPISAEDAELIQSLHSLYKRFIRLQASKDEWLVPSVYAEFEKGIIKALSSIST